METIFLNIRAEGKGRPRMTRSGIVYTPQKTRDYERRVREAYTGECFPGKVAVTIVAYYEPPKSLSQKKRDELLGCRYDKKPDLDNMANAVLDALNGKAYTDDMKVVELTVNKFYGSPESLVVYVEEVEQ